MTEPVQAVEEHPGELRRAPAPKATDDLSTPVVQQLALTDFKHS